jgi:signal transduction histidine kinase
MARQVAHDIKNPLTPIQLAAEHLQRVHDDAARPLGPVVEHCLRTILGQVRLLRQIASEFSTFAGSPTPRFEAVDVGALMERVVEPYRASSPVGVRMSVTAVPGLPAAWTDRTLVARALTNLVENAIQAMPSGGQLEVSATSRADTIEVRVVDSGVGMAAEDVQRAFEPYFSTKTAGSGLGLANARRNIETCGGTLTLESAPGQGTTVTMRLPAARPGEPGAAR